MEFGVRAGCIVEQEMTWCKETAGVGLGVRGWMKGVETGCCGD